MDIILTKEQTEAVAKLADLIKTDARYMEMQKTSEAYNSNEKINKLLDEYSALQAALSAEYEKEGFDPASTKKIQERMNEIYEAVVAEPDYTAFREASELYSEFTEAIYAEIEYAITGKRKSACTHNCATCGGC